jgi:hypothetical protein
MDKRTLQCARLREAVLSNCYAQRLILCRFFLTVITDVQADNPLPAITVIGRATPTPRPLDTVGRDWVERSPEMHWPTPMFNRAAEIFAHNQIVINASCETVWDHLIHAELWPHWCPYSGKVTIWGGSVLRALWFPPTKTGTLNRWVRKNVW